MDKVNYPARKILNPYLFLKLSFFAPEVNSFSAHPNWEIPFPPVKTVKLLLAKIKGQILLLNIII
ncbi:MAG: hypothetical protein AMJ90_06505 [candidate division Zixibacteria bacterium SM23_73_2]|nr:MAG: hypothetical protein AMJ90_06505 [candidate division Zixibacteria bacterium SM23_73_2]